MALADIIQYIETESGKQAESILSAAKEEEKSIIDTAEQESQQYSSARFHEFEEEKVFREKKSASVQQQSERLKVSQFHASLVDEVYDTFLSHLSSFSPEEIKRLCVSYLSILSETEGSISSCGTEVSILKDAVKDAGKDFEVHEGDDTVGGFIFHGDGYVVDFSFPVIVRKYLREKTEADLLTLLTS